MAPKRPVAPPKKGLDLSAMAASKSKKEKPKKPPPPPACFKPEEIARFKEVFKQFDTDDIDRVKIEKIPIMLRYIGFNPKGAEVAELFKRFLEDDLVDMVELHEWYLMIEAKKNMGDDVEHDVTLAMCILGQDDEEKPKEIIKLETLQEELMKWGEPLSELEFADWPKVALKDKTYVYETGDFSYVKFIENMNAKDVRFLPEPINYFKLDQRQLAALAMQKAAEEREIIKMREQDRVAREQAKRQRLIDSGAIQADDVNNMPVISTYKEPPNAFDILNKGY